jgi:hypothetical protein
MTAPEQPDLRAFGHGIWVLDGSYCAMFDAFHIARLSRHLPQRA